MPCSLSWRAFNVIGRDSEKEGADRNFLAASSQPLTQTFA